MGKNDWMNQQIRQAAGRGRYVPPEQEQPAGHGSADGGAGSGSKPRLSFAAQMNAMFRDRTHHNLSFDVIDGKIIRRR